MDRDDWRVTASSYVLESPYLRLRKDSIELPNGTAIDEYYVRESRGYVIVFALTTDQRAVLVRQYKHGVGKVLLELVAGAIDEGETPHETAVRELAEETGYTAPQVEFVRSFVTDPTSANTLAHLFFAQDAAKTTRQQLDVTENIAVETATLPELRALVRAGDIDSMPHVGAIYFMLDRYFKGSI